MNKLLILIIISTMLSRCGTVSSYESIGLKYIADKAEFEKNLSTLCGGDFEITDSIFVYQNSYGKPELFFVKDSLKIPDSIAFQYSMKDYVISPINIRLEKINNYSFIYTEHSKYNYDKYKYSDIDDEITSKELNKHFILLRITESYNYDGNIIIEYWFKRGFYCSGVTYTVVINSTNGKVVSCIIKDSYHDRNG